MLKAVEASASCRLFETTLTAYYIPLEVWYTRTILDKVCFLIIYQYTSPIHSLGACLIKTRFDAIPRYDHNT